MVGTCWPCLKEAMEHEIAALRQNNTWTLIPRSSSSIKHTSLPTVCGKSRWPTTMRPLVWPKRQSQFLDPQCGKLRLEMRIESGHQSFYCGQWGLKALSNRHLQCLFSRKVRWENHYRAARQLCRPRIPQPHFVCSTRLCTASSRPRRCGLDGSSSSIVVWGCKGIHLYFFTSLATFTPSYSCTLMTLLSLMLKTPRFAQLSTSMVVSLQCVSLGLTFFLGIQVWHMQISLHHNQTNIYLICCGVVYLTPFILLPNLWRLMRISTHSTTRSRTLVNNGGWWDHFSTSPSPDQIFNLA